jgi:HemY protein
MIKLLMFFVVLAALAFGLAQLADYPGQVLVQLGEMEIKLSVLTALLGVFGMAFAILVTWTLLRFVLRLPGLMSMATRLRRKAMGHKALARGLVAVGVGDQRQAQRFARESQRLLGDDPLALLLNAQAAQLAGDSGAAQTAFKAMLDAPETQSLGLRGLFIEAERRNDRVNARIFAEQAYRASPESAWASRAMLGFFSADKDWRGALSLIDQSISRRLIDRQAGQKQRAILLTASALDLAGSNPDEALSVAMNALRIEPGLVPAAVLAAKRLAARGDYAKASKVIEAAWKKLPHPDLAAAYLGVRAGDSALDRLKRGRMLLKLMPQAREARFAVARASLDAREFAAAREALESLALEKASLRVCLLMAELEERESANLGLVRAWLARASVAPRDPAWIAEGYVSEEWLPCSPISGQIGAFEWREPPQAPEAGLRARIEADRFVAALAIADGSQKPEVELAPNVDPALEAGPQLLEHDAFQREVQQQGVEPLVEPMVSPLIGPTAAAALPVEKPDLPGPIIPDDPGLEETPKARGGRRFFD